MLKQILLSILLLVTISAPADAQIWKKVKKSAERAAEKRAERETEKAVNEAIDDAIEGQTDDEDAGDVQDDDKDERSNDFLSGMMGSSADVPDQYDFKYEIEYTIRSNKDESNLTYLLDDQGSYFGFVTEDKGNKTKMVLDLDRDIITMYIEDNKGEKSGQILPSFMNKQFINNEIEESNENIEITKTGRTKNILDYICHEYIALSEDGEATTWIAPEIKTSLTKVFGSSMAKNKKAKNMASIMKAMDGFVMESHYRDLKSKKNNTDMMATKINKNPAPLKKADYSWTN